MKKVAYILIGLFCLCLSGCAGLLDGSTPYPLEGEWGMMSGGIERYGKFEEIDVIAGGPKTITFLSDGTFTETCKSLVAKGTYEVKAGSVIKYKYTSIPEGGPEYFAIHESGKWTYQFWASDSMTLYDYASPALEVSMTFARVFD